MDTVRPVAERLPDVAVTGTALTAAHPEQRFAPKPLLSPIELPESSSDRLKDKLLGPPLRTEDLGHERLGKPTALAVFASDNLSSVAYATEEILLHLVPYVGVAAFALVMPITGALLVILAFLVLSYRQTIKAYPSAGGAYVVTRDNFGLLPAQVAGVALMTDYVLTVAVSVAAGTAALTSTFHPLAPYAVPVSLVFIAFIAYGNLRGVRQSGRMFALPTYFFIGAMVALLGVGLERLLSGDLPIQSTHAPGMVPIGHGGEGLVMGVGLYVLLRAFASGGAAVTGVEAISNGVPAFRPPAWQNARTTLVLMASTLGAMFLGLSFLAAKTHVIPYEDGTPTVISQIAKLVFGEGAVGHALYYCLQLGTMLILVLAANTSFADFPRLASFHAADHFMPRRLTKRGQRLVFSNGIISLAVGASVLVAVTGARVDHLIPLYAIGVFTSFTLSQAGMAKHHLARKEAGWRRGLFVNGTGAVLSGMVNLAIVITKFKPPGAILGAWLVLVLVPIMVVLLVRLHRRYETEAEELRRDAPRAATAPLLRRHAVLILVDELDLGAVRAIQYARTLAAHEVKALHFDVDAEQTNELAAAWERIGLAPVPLELVECPDRRIARAAAEAAAEAVADGETELTVVISRRRSTKLLHGLLHDKTADAIAEAVADVPHCNLTFVPFRLDVGAGAAHVRSLASERDVVPGGRRPDCVPIATVRHRQHVRVVGRVHALRVECSDRRSLALECTLGDETGRLTIVFLGRRRLPGLGLGSLLLVEGTVGEHHRRLALLNPAYEIIAA